MHEPMKILKVCVGTAVKKDPRISDVNYISAESFNTSGHCWYLKKEIINQISQVNSLKSLGLDVTYAFLSARKSLGALIQFGISLRKKVHEQGINLVHVDWGSATALIAVIFSPVGVVISFCGSDLMGSVGPYGRRTFLGSISKFLSQLAAMGAKRIITKSKNLKDALWAISRTKAVVIPNGVDLKVFYPIQQDLARAKLGWPLKGRIVIFFVSGGAYVKNQPLAEEMCAIVKKEIPDLQLKLIDNVPHEDLVYYYNAADIMLLTSFHEGSNNSLKEAMCCNLPVVSVDCGDARERLQVVYNSWVEESGEPAILAQHVLAILNNGQRSDARVKVEDISMENIARKIKAVYLEG